jgi:1,4-dihydroxy-2-naphthoate octaprenyltransferase
VIALLVPLIFFADDRDVWSLLPLGVVPMAWSHFQRLSEKKSPSELIALLGDTGKLLSLYALLLAIGLGLGRAD